MGSDFWTGIMFAVFGLLFLAAFSTATPTGVVGWSPRDFGIVERIVFKTSECSECGMSDSRINVKMCGGATAPCCGIVNVGANSNKAFERGRIDEFSGAEDLEDCSGYHLSGIEVVENFDMTVYHEGADGGQFDWIEVITSSTRVRCNLGFQFEGQSRYKLEFCAIL